MSPFLGYYQFEGFVPEALASEKLRSVVDQSCSIARKARQFCQRSADMTRAANHQSRFGLDPLEKHCRTAPTQDFGSKFLNLEGLCVCAARQEALREISGSPVQSFDSKGAERPPGIVDEKLSSYVLASSDYSRKGADPAIT
jgi:hypothetical protein